MGKPVILDRVYVGTLVCFVTVTAVNIRIALERPRLMLQTAGYLHVIACFIGGLGALIMAANEILGWELCQQLHFGCASGHVAKILGHIINFMRLDSVSRFSNPVRIGFGVLMLAKAAAASCHCTFFKPTLIPDQNLCLPILEPKSTNVTYGMEVAIDFVFAFLFVFKLYQHLDQFRDIRGRTNSALQPMYRQFLFEVIPFVIVSVIMNSFILSGHWGPYSICFIYLDFAFSVRVTNDLVFLSRLSRPDNLWSDGSLVKKFTGAESYTSTASYAGPPPPAISARPFAATVTTNTITNGDKDPSWSTFNHNHTQSVEIPLNLRQSGSVDYTRKPEV